MKRIYAPWRSKYLKKDLKERYAPESQENCVFCTMLADNKDEKNLIIKRFEHCAIFLNLHPYNAGHLLVIPNNHKSHLYMLDKEIRTEIIEVINISAELLEKTLKSDGINIGSNIGDASGGSIHDHLHFHVVPRWLNDTNFLVAVADTKQISFDLIQIYNQLRKAFEQD